MALKTPFIGTETAAGAPITTDLMDVKVRQNMEDLDERLVAMVTRIDNLVIPSGGGGGITEAEVNALLQPWARADNTATIPAAKLPTANSAVPGILRFATVSEATAGTLTTAAMTPQLVAGTVEDFALSKNPSTEVPESKLPDATPTQKGIFEIADTNDADTGTSSLHAMTPELTTRVVNAATTGAAIKGKLEGLSGTNRLAASAIKDLPTGGGGRADFLQELDAAPTSGLGTTYPAGAVIRTPDNWLELVHDDDADAHGVKIDAGRDGNYFGYNNIDDRFKKIGSAFRETDQKIVDDPVGAIFTNLSNGQVEVFLANDSLGASVPGTIYVRFYRATPAEASAFLTTSMTRSATGDITEGGVTYRKYVSLEDVWDSEDEQPQTFYARFFTASPATNNQTANPLDIFGEYEWHAIDEAPGKPVHDADVSHDLDFVVWETDHVERRPVQMSYQDDSDNKFFEGNVVLIGNQNANLRIYQVAHGDSAERGRISLVMTGGVTDSPFVGKTWDKIRWRVGRTGSWTTTAVRRDTEFANAYAVISTAAFSSDPAGLTGTSFPNGVTIYINPGFSDGTFAYSDEETVRREKLSKDKLVEFVTDEMSKNPARILQRVTSLPAMADDGTEVFLISDQVENGHLQDKVEDQLTLSGTSYSTSSSQFDHEDLLQLFAQSSSAIHYLYRRSDNGNVIVIGRDSRSGGTLSGNNYISSFGGREFEYNAETKTFGDFVRNWIPGGNNVNAHSGDVVIHLYGEYFLAIESNWYSGQETDNYIKVYRFNENTNRLIEATGNKPTASVDFKVSSTSDETRRISMNAYRGFAGGFVYNGVLYLVVQGRPQGTANQNLSDDTTPAATSADRYKLSLVAYDIDNSQGGPRFTFNYSKCVFYFYEWLSNDDSPTLLHNQSLRNYKAYLRGNTFYITNYIQNQGSSTANLPLIAFDLSIGTDGSVSVAHSQSKTSNVSPGYPIGGGTSWGPSIIASNISTDLYLRKYLSSLRSNKIGALQNAVSNRRGIYVREGLLWSPVQRVDTPTGAGVGVTSTPRRVPILPADSDSKEGERVFVEANYMEPRGVDITPQDFAGTELDGLGLGTRGWYSKPDAGFQFGKLRPTIDSNIVLISNNRVYVVRGTRQTLIDIVANEVNYPLTLVNQAAGTKILTNPAYAANQPDVDYYTIGNGGLPAGDWDFVYFTSAVNWGATNLRNANFSASQDLTGAGFQYVMPATNALRLIHNLFYYTSGTSGNESIANKWVIHARNAFQLRSHSAPRRIYIGDQSYPFAGESPTGAYATVDAVTADGQFPSAAGAFDKAIRIEFANGQFYNFSSGAAVGSLATPRRIPTSVQILKGYYYFDGSDWQFDDYQAQAVDTTKNFKILTQEGDRIRTVDKTALDALSAASADTRIAAKVTELNLKTQWFGTQAEFDAISAKDENTVYNIFSS